MKCDNCSKVSTLLLAVFILLVFIGGFFIWRSYFHSFNPVKTEEQENCENLCGNGTCEEIVCMAIGCPCAETKRNCPQDCK